MNASVNGQQYLLYAPTLLSLEQFLYFGTPTSGHVTQSLLNILFNRVRRQKFPSVASLRFFFLFSYSSY